MCCLLAAAAALRGESVPVVSSARLLAPQPGEWLIYGREYNNQRFSPLAQITRDNVSRTRPSLAISAQPVATWRAAGDAPDS
jgi:glucose dehydrogenase